MHELDEYFKDEFKRETSFSISPMYMQCLRKLSVKIYVEDEGYVATTLRRVIVTEGINIMKGEKINYKLWLDSGKVKGKNIIMLKVNEKIEELLKEVTMAHFMSRSHFVRYAVLKTFYKYFPPEEIWKAKVVGLGRLF